MSLAIVATSWVALRSSVGARVRPLAPLLLDATMATWCWAVVATVSGRLVLAALVVAAGSAGLVLVDQVKRATVREPVVFSDRAELIEVLRHPGLYLPFAGTALVLSITGLMLALTLALAWIEPVFLTPALRCFGLASLVLVYFSFGVPRLLLWASTIARTWGPRLDPAADMRQFGMLASFVVHAALARAARPELQARLGTNRDIAAPPPCRPIVLVQAESFMDVRRLDPNMGATLPHYAAAARNALQLGGLEVPCWGANTIRTEFAVLTGIDTSLLGLDGFNPYERFARVKLRSIAWRLRACGYRTIFVHPFDLAFYGRRSVLPQLGFDTLIGPDAFAPAAPGCYVSDIALAAVVSDLLHQHGPRCFIFAVTIQTHGPWAPAAAAGLAGRASSPLGGYLNALRAADAAIPQLCAAATAHDAVLAYYGDHRPALPDLSDSATATDYMIWDPRGGFQCRTDLAAHRLGEALQQIAINERPATASVAA